MYLDHLVAFWDMSTVDPPNLAPNTYGLNNATGTSILPADIVNGVGGGKGIDLDGANDWFSCGNDASLKFGTGDFSMFTWMRTDSDATRQIMIADEGVTTSIRGWEFSYRGDVANDPIRVQLNDNNAGSIYTLDYNTGGIAGGLHFVGFVADRDGDGQIYFDGDKVASSSLSGFTGSVTNANNMVIGRQSFALALRLFNGLLDSIPIFNSTLTETQVKDLMKRTWRGEL